MTVSYTKYVPKHLKEQYEALGWKINDSLKETPHGEFSYIGTWRGRDNEHPPMPDREP